MRGLTDYIFDIDVEIISILRQYISITDNGFFVDFSKYPYNGKLFDSEKFAETVGAMVSHVKTFKLKPVYRENRDNRILDVFWDDKTKQYMVDDD